MSEISLLKDASFLKQLDLENLKTYYVKVIVLDNNEIPLREIEGRVSAGSNSINGNSSTRRAGNLNFLADESKNDLTEIDNLLSMNKKIKVLVGIENTVDKVHDSIIWFKQGIFVITQPTLTHGTNGVNISLQIKDKMCLLDGSCGGGLPTSVTFHEYDQMIGLSENLSQYPTNPNNYTVYQVNGKYLMWDPTLGWKEATRDLAGTVMTIPQRMFDIIQTIVANYGNEDLARIIINDVPLEIRNAARFVGSGTLYYNARTKVYTLDEDAAAINEGEWKTFGYNEDCGYVYTDFVYPGQLISSIGDNVCSVLDKIKNALGNYEYFYDLDGNFVFQEKKNYLNTQYDPIQTLSKDGFLLSKDNYFVDFSNGAKSVYTFEEGSALISSFSNTPSYTNIKNDFHVWGKNNDGFAIHYHLVIKSKPDNFSTWMVVYDKDDEGNYTGRLHLAKNGEVGVPYTPTDWRAEIYCQGLEKQRLQIRPDIYEQELLDLFDDIYNMKEQEFKADIVNRPNDLNYWIDYINPAELYDISVDAIGSKIYTYQKDKITKLYNPEIPNVLMINMESTPYAQAHIIKRCEDEGQEYSRLAGQVYDLISVGTTGYTAQETARDLLYQYTNYNSAISISSIPIYYLDVNSRITVIDRASGIYGDYVVNSINLPFDAKGTMTISASKALERV